MIELLEALLLWFNDDASGPLSADFTGGWYQWQAPPGTVTNYAVITPQSAENTAAYGKGAIYSEPELQFATWAVSAAASAALIKKLITKLDTLNIALSGGRRLQHNLRLNDPMPMPGSGAKDETGSVVFGWYVIIRFAVST